jgi:hypothetical protein
MRREEFDGALDEIENLVKKSNVDGAQIMSLMLIAGLLYDINLSIQGGEVYPVKAYETKLS